MKKQITAIVITLFLLLTTGCGAPVGNSDQLAAPASLHLADGRYQVAVTLKGGSGRASICSPAKLRVENGKAVITIEWSSSTYDYMIVDGVRYEPVTTEEHSVFEIPIGVFDDDVLLTADTVAMSEPHEIDYTLRLDSATLETVTDPWENCEMLRLICFPPCSSETPRQRVSGTKW